MPPMRERIKWGLGGLLAGAAVIGLLLWKGWATCNALLTGGTVALALAVMLFCSYDPAEPDPTTDNTETDDPSSPGWGTTAGTCAIASRIRSSREVGDRCSLPVTDRLAGITGPGRERG
jgi:hypothetical protein